MIVLGYLILYCVHILIAPFVLIGAIRKGKAVMQGRQGPPLFQPLFDTVKLLGKSETISSTAFWSFYAAPVVGIAAVTAVALMTPWLGVQSPIAGDLFLVAYLLAIVKFVTGLSALDTASSFGAIGASRESAVSLFAEPALVASLAALAMQAHSSRLPAVFAHGHTGYAMTAIAGLAAIAIWMAAMADMSRMPVDDPTTHLELTMIHEAQILENSGRNLALVQYAVSLRAVVLIGITARVVMLALPPLPPILSYAVCMALIALGACLIALSESVMVRLRWRRLPNLLSFAVVASMLACLIAALKG